MNLSFDPAILLCIHLKIMKSSPVLNTIHDIKSEKQPTAYRGIVVYASVECHSPLKRDILPFTTTRIFPPHGTYDFSYIPKKKKKLELNGGYKEWRRD